jgi:predicted flap endonuclease-1-like 5' DNA nuclease
MLRIPGITPGEVRLLHEAGIETAGHLAALGGDDAAAREGRSKFLRRMDLVREQLARQASLHLRVPDETRLIGLATAAAGVESRIRSR